MSNHHFSSYHGSNVLTVKSGDSPEDVEMSDDDDFVALGIKITVKEDEVHVRWLRGTDSVLFESFCGMLKRAITS